MKERQCYKSSMEIFASYICNMEMFLFRAAVNVVKSHSFVHIHMISVCANSVLRPQLKSEEQSSGNEIVSAFVIDLYVYCVQLVT